MSFTIFDIPNPSYETVTNTFKIQVKSQDLLTTFFEETITGVGINAQEFGAITATLGFPYLWSISTLYLNIDIPSQTDYLRLTFPSIWQN